MNAQLLLKYFDRISEAHDAVPRLRRFILDLAVRGKLVEQDAREEPASELLREILADRHHLIKLRTKGDTLPEISANEIPYELPRGWEWARLGHLGDTNIGLTYSPQDVSDDGVPVLRSNNIRDGKLVLSEIVRVDTAIKESVLVKEGDLLICARNGSRALVGKTAIIGELKEPTAFGAFMAVFRSKLNRYIYHFICSPLFRLMIDEVNTTTINQITQTNLRSTLAPIPPFLEQHRIVAKVEELMTLCDRLESAQSERENRRDRAAKASLYHLSGGAKVEEIQEYTHFYLDHFTELGLRARQITRLRHAILNFAVQGKLVHQIESDESTSDLLKRIQLEKMWLMKKANIESLPQALPAEEDKVPYDLPANWRWVRISAILLSSFYGPRFGADEYSSTGVPTIRTTDMTADGRIVLRNPPKVIVSADRLKDFECKRGDLLITRTGSIGTMAVFDSDYQAIPSAYLIRLRFATAISVHYIHIALRSPYGQQALGLNTTKVAQPNINAKNLAAIPVPLPPLAEQHRIVKRVNELLSICDRLETQLDRAQFEKGRLLESVLHHSLLSGTEITEKVAL